MKVRGMVLGITGSVVAAAMVPIAAEAEEPSAALEHAQAMVDTAGVVTGAEFVEQPDPSSAMTSTTSTAGFPTVPGTYSVLSSGRASRLTEPNDSDSSGDGLGGISPERGDTAYDVTVLRVDLNVPAGVELPGRPGLPVPLRGVSRSTSAAASTTRSSPSSTGRRGPRRARRSSRPTTSPSTPTATRSSINTAGGSLDERGVQHRHHVRRRHAQPDAPATPITPGAHSIFLSIFDQGDHSLRLGGAARQPAASGQRRRRGNCSPGAELAGARATSPLGDSFSSGFGNSPYYAGTHEDGGNDCQRSPQSYGAIVAVELDYKLYDEPGPHWVFQACQGGVTKDFYSPREHCDWGELPQLDYLNTNAGAGHAVSSAATTQSSRGIFTECIARCRAAALEHLLGRRQGRRRAAAQLRAAARRRRRRRRAARRHHPAPDALLGHRRAGAVRHPRRDGLPAVLLPRAAPTRCSAARASSGPTRRTSSSGSRDLTEKIIKPYAYAVRLPGSPTRTAGSWGTSSAASDEWFYGLTHPGKVHPNVQGQAAIAETVLEQLLNDPRERFVIEPGETESTRFKVTRRLQSLSAFIAVAGQRRRPDAGLALGLVTYSRSGAPAGAEQDNGPTSERSRSPTRRSVEWTVRMFGKDVATGGEDVWLTMAEEELPNQAPVPAFSVTYDGSTLRLDGSASSDPDGSVERYRWYVDNGTREQVVEGRQAQLSLAPGSAVAVTLQVTDDRGDSEFALKRWRRSTSSRGPRDRRRSTRRPTASPRWRSSPSTGSTPRRCRSRACGRPGKAPRAAPAPTARTSTRRLPDLSPTSARQRCGSCAGRPHCA